MAIVDNLLLFPFLSACVCHVCMYFYVCRSFVSTAVQTCRFFDENLQLSPICAGQAFRFLLRSSVHSTYLLRYPRHVSVLMLVLCCLLTPQMLAEACVAVATHRHGCCVLQRAIDAATVEQSRLLVSHVSQHALQLMQV